MPHSSSLVSVGTDATQTPREHSKATLQCSPGKDSQSKGSQLRSSETTNDHQIPHLVAASAVACLLISLGDESQSLAHDRRLQKNEGVDDCELICGTF